METQLVGWRAALPERVTLQLDKTHPAWHGETSRRAPGPPLRGQAAKIPRPQRLEWEPGWHLQATPAATGLQPRIQASTSGDQTADNPWRRDSIVCSRPKTSRASSSPAMERGSRMPHVGLGSGAEAGFKLSASGQGIAA